MPIYTGKTKCSEPPGFNRPHFLAGISGMLSKPKGYSSLTSASTAQSTLLTGVVTINPNQIKFI